MKEYFTIAWKQMSRRKLNSWLTLAGVIIGITAIVSLMSLGQGLENAISGQLESLGDDILFITPKGSSLTPGLSTGAVSITEDDEKVVENTEGVKKTTSMIFSSARMEFNDQVRYFFIIGMPDDKEERELIGEGRSFKILKGRSLEKGDDNKVVLGWEHTQDALFGKPKELGDKVLIQNKVFKVIGFYEKIGSPPDDRQMYITLDAYSKLFDTDELGMVLAQVKSGENVEEVSEKIKKNLRDSRNLDEGKEDFNVETPTQLIGAFSTILDLVQIVIIGIALISLAVGGIGITNSMYTSVLQRTKEIGVIKALGGRRKDIFLLFLIESGFYGFVGGLIGIGIGIIFAKSVEFLFHLFIGSALLIININWNLMILILLGSFILGSLAGITPAWQAAKINPVESLRYE